MTWNEKFQIKLRLKTARPLDRFTLFLNCSEVDSNESLKRKTFTHQPFVEFSLGPCFSKWTKYK